MTTKKTPDLPDKSAYVHTHTLPDGTTYTHSHAHGSKSAHDHEGTSDSAASGDGSSTAKAANAGAAAGSSGAAAGSSGAAGATSASISAASGTTVDPDKLIALLTFFVGHNEQHAEELAELIPALPEDIQDKMMLAIGTLEAANVDLQGVLDYLIAKKKEG